MQQCRWCGRRFELRGRSRPPAGVLPAGCRQQAHLARKLAAAHGLGTDDVIVSRPAIEELQGALYCLQAAIEDVDRDLAVSSTPTDLTDALNWILQNARPAAALWIEPRQADA